MKTLIFFFLGVVFSCRGWADGGCSSVKTPGCFIWFSALILGAGLLFWVSCLPILLLLDFFLELKIAYKKWFLAISFLGVTGLVFLMSSERYRYLFYNTIFEGLQKYDIWIFTPILYILIYLCFYLAQKRPENGS